MCPHLADLVIEAEVTRMIPAPARHGTLVEVRPLRVIQGRVPRAGVTFFLPGVEIDRPLPARDIAGLGYELSQTALAVRPPNRIAVLLREVPGAPYELSAARDALFLRTSEQGGWGADAQGVDDILTVGCDSASVSVDDAPAWVEEWEEFDEFDAWWNLGACLEPAPEARIFDTDGERLPWEDVVGAIARCAARPPHAGEVRSPLVPFVTPDRDAAFAGRTWAHWRALQSRLLRLAGADAQEVNNRINRLYMSLSPAARGQRGPGWPALVASQRAVLAELRADPAWMADPGLAAQVALIEDAFADYDRGQDDPWAGF
jgi:hypothetical protein